jgi:hypothetical protein
MLLCLLMLGNASSCILHAVGQQWMRLAFRL